MEFIEKKEYYKKLREDALKLKNHQLKVGQNIIKTIYPKFRKYKLEIEGEENIPKDSNVIFVANHSNSHDIFTAYEVFSLLERRGSVMVATDCLNPVTTGVFNISNATLLDRRKKEKKQKSILTMSNKILNGNDGLIFGESTWNLHPVLPMHNIKKGASKISAITQVPIIPTIIEYIESDSIVDTEEELYKKCLVRFGKPIMINCDEDLISQTNKIRQEMIRIRKEIWKDYYIIRDRVSEIDPVKYLNNTYIKKFKAFGFTYDSKKEQEFLLFLENERKENEYTLNRFGELSPGITEKESELGKLLKK